MQKALEMQSFEMPKDLSLGSKKVFNDLVENIDQTHKHYLQRIEFLKQQFKIAMRQLRPAFIAEGTLAELFDESEFTSEEETSSEEGGISTDPPKKRSKKKKAIPDHLPRTVVVHDLKEEEKICEQDGSTLKPMGFDIKEELKYHPARFEVLEHRYPKYSCPSCSEGVKRQPPLPSLIPQSYVSPELLAHLAVSKFCNHLPLYRLEKMFSREGIHISRQVMSQWIIKLGESLRPLIGLMNEIILESEVVAGDETPVKLLTKEGVRTSTQAYMWQLSRWGPSPLIIFEFDQTRKKEVAQKLFAGYRGFVQVDGYSGYTSIFVGEDGPIRVGCLAHCLRKFKDLLLTTPKEKRVGHSALKIIKKIGEIYKIEEECRGFGLSERFIFRISSGAPRLIKELQAAVAEEREQVAVSSPYYAALNYSFNALPFVARYLEHGGVEVDNNKAENAIRPFALGRRNWLFICSEAGAEASANIYSILNTALANKIEPYSYLKKLITELPLCKTSEDYEKLLPSNI